MTRPRVHHARRTTLPMRGRLALPLALAGMAAIPALVARDAEAGPAADLWPRFERHDPSSTAIVEHDALAELLERYLVMGEDGVTRVRYAALKAERRAALDAYVESLQAVDVDALARPEQTAYWFNLYNALTLAVVVEHYPVSSIRDINISPGLFSGLLARGPWRKKLVRVVGEELSLDDMEHRILRPIWQDPRIHYAVNCAAIGCPNLQPRPFTGENLETMLERGAVDYVNNWRGVALVERTFGADQLTLSRIYDWFQEDFRGSEAGVLEHVRGYASGRTAQMVAGVETIDAYRYDWGLNDSDA